jgi:hypothetical protein
MSDSSTSLTFASALKTVVNNSTQEARRILEERAPGLLRTRDFIVAANFVLTQQLSAEIFGKVLPPEELSSLDHASLLELQSRVRPIMLEVFDECALEKALGYRR